MITALLVNLLITAIGLACATLLVSGISAKNYSAFFIAATVLGLINSFIRPLLWLITVPLSVLTLGLFALVINALMLMLAAALVPGFEVNGFGSAFIGSIIIAIIGIAGSIALLLLTGADISWYSYEYHSQSI